MLISGSLKQKIAATCGAVLGLVLLHDVTMLDSNRTTTADAEARELTAKPAPGARLRFMATAYCKGTTTAAGTAVRTGVAAADPELLPVGSVIRVDALGAKYNGIYTIMDTGPAVQGREIDIYMWSCREALAFGRRRTGIQVLRLGWNPKASSADVNRSMFRKRESELEKMSPPPDQHPSPEAPGSRGGSTAGPGDPATSAPPPAPKL